MGIDRKKLAVIHIIKKELGLADSEYRDILKQAAGVTSARDLDDVKFRKLMRHFVRSRYYRVNSLGLTLRQKIYINHLAEDLGWDESHLLNFVRKYYHKSTIDALTKQEAINLIESLKNVKKHQA